MSESNPFPSELTDLGPPWLARIRRGAWDRYQETPPPTPSEEGWRRLPLSRLLPGAFSPSKAGSAAPAAPAAEPGAVALEQADGGRTSPPSGPASSLPAGTVFCSLSEAAERHAGLVQGALADGNGASPPESGRFSHLRRALVSGGFVVHVPARTRLEVRLHAVHRIESAGANHFPVTLVRLEEGAELTLVEEMSSGADASGFVSPSTDVFLGAEAKLRYVCVQAESRAISHLGEFRAFLSRDARVEALFLTSGGGAVRNAIATLLAGRGAAAQLYGIVLGDGTQHLEHHIRAEHTGPDTRSELLFKAAVGGQARSVFTGNIQIRREARRSQGMQTLRNLVLSEEARADAVPNLEIEADDVSCKHAASIGPVDPEMLFYLESRGIPPAEAEKLVVHGFVEDALRKFEPDEASPLARWLSARLTAAQVLP